MKKLTITLSTAALVLGAVVLSASAQTQSAGAASIHALKNATPIYTQAACRGFGPHCGPGFVWTCGRYGRCWCRPCY
jgi:hypothetical protein